MVLGLLCFEPTSISIFIYYEERKAGRKEDIEAVVRRERGWREVNVKPYNRK